MCKFLLIYINFSLSCVSFIHFFALLFTLWVGSFRYYYSLIFSSFSCIHFTSNFSVFLCFHDCSYYLFLPSEDFFEAPLMWLVWSCWNLSVFAFAVFIAALLLWVIVFVILFLSNRFPLRTLNILFHSVLCCKIAAKKPKLFSYRRCNDFL